MTNNLLGLRKAAGYRNASDFAEAHGIPASTYARYESSPDKIPLRAAWQLADILGTSIDVIVGREAPDPACVRGEVQLEYDGLTTEARALADEFREFVRAKDARIREARRREGERPYDALCYQYERQMLSEMRDSAAFGELVTFDCAADARTAFLEFLQKQAATRRGRLATEAQMAADSQIIEGIMAAYDRTHGEFEYGGTSVMWSSVDRRVAPGRGSAGKGRDGDAGR